MALNRRLFGIGLDTAVDKNRTLTSRGGVDHERFE